MTRIAVVVEDAAWRKEGKDFPAALRRAAKRALAASGSKRAGDLTILLSEDAKLEALNMQFRGKPKPTNVLSFPTGDEGYLGDVAIAYGTAAREARAAAKSIHDHTIHLTVHGVLHLLGYDHETAREARTMEPLEIAILSELGIANPYAVRVAVTD